MKAQPEFDQWTDQNHVPFCDMLRAKNSENSTSSHSRHRLSMLWQNIKGWWSHSTESGFTTAAKKPRVSS